MRTTKNIPIIDDSTGDDMNTFNREVIKETLRTKRAYNRKPKPAELKSEPTSEPTSVEPIPEPDIEQLVLDGLNFMDEHAVSTNPNTTGDEHIASPAHLTTNLNSVGTDLINFHNNFYNSLATTFDNPATFLKTAQPTTSNLPPVENQDIRHLLQTLIAENEAMKTELNRKNQDIGALSAQLIESRKQLRGYQKDSMSPSSELSAFIAQQLERIVNETKQPLSARQLKKITVLFRQVAREVAGVTQMGKKKKDMLPLMEEAIFDTAGVLIKHGLIDYTPRKGGNQYRNKNKTNRTQTDTNRTQTDTGTVAVDYGVVVSNHRGRE